MSRQDEIKNTYTNKCQRYQDKNIIQSLYHIKLSFPGPFLFLLVRDLFLCLSSIVEKNLGMRLVQCFLNTTLYRIVIFCLL